MRILIDALPVMNGSGTGYYVQKLVAALARLPTEHEFVAATPPLDRRALDADWPGGENVTVLECAPARPALQAVWRQWRLAAVARRVDAAVVHYPAFLGCLRCAVPSVVTIPDVVWRLHRDTVPPRKRRYYDRVIPRTMQQARRIITISDATREELTREFPEYGSRAQTIHLGVDRRVFRPVGDRQLIERVRRDYRLPPLYVLALSTLEPRKNLPALVRAFESIAAEVPKMHLVLAGKAGYQADQLRALADASPVRDRIRFLGHVAPADLPAVYSLARVFAYPSLNEGFGLPILEAMACGVPVVTSDRSAMCEVAGTAAELVDPTVPAAIARGLRRILQGEQTREVYVRRGFARAAELSWERTAAKTVAVYEEAVA